MMYNKTFSCIIRDKCDAKLKSIAKEQQGIVPFATTMDSLLKDFGIRVEPVAEKYLQSYGDDAYQKIYALYFYLCKLEKNGLIEFVRTASVAPFPIEGLGKKGNNLTESYRINEKIADFWNNHINDNIIVSPEYFEYINAGRVPLELKEARKQTFFAFITLLISIITILLAWIF